MKPRHFAGITAALFCLVLSVVAGPNWSGDALVTARGGLHGAAATPAIVSKSITGLAAGTVTRPAASLARVKPFASVVPAPPAAAPPNAPVLFAPNNGGTGITSPTTLDVSVSDPAGSNTTVTFFGRPAATPGADFNLIVLPDTQYYSSTMNGGTPSMFNTQTQWIVSNQAALNIPYVTSVGDVVQTGDNDGNNTEWIVADTAYKILENAGIPYAVVPGNHDEGNDLSNLGSASITDQFNNWFGVSRFTGRPYYGGHFGTANDNHYDLFSVSGMDFIVIHFAYDESPTGTRFQNVLTWANGILKQFPSRRAILVSHYILNNGNPATFGPQGQALFTALSNNPNLFLTLSGHIGFPGEGQRSDTVNGNVIQSVMSDFQDRAAGGDGWMRIMTFSPANNTISVKTFSPVLNQNMTDVGSQFTLPYNMQNNGYAVLGTVTGVASGARAQAAWNGLDANSSYQWYVTVNNGTSTTTGPVWSFTSSSGGTGPAVSLSQSSLTFASQQINTTSGSQSVTLTNSGGATLNLTSILPSGDFASTNTCGSTLAANGNCSISVTFTPAATGTRTGAITITDNATGSPQSISLTGTGASAPAPAVTLAPGSLTFSSQLLNTTSGSKPVTLTNSGTATLNIASIVPSGDYSDTTTCGSTLTANANCSISVTFTPTAAGTRNGAITITDDAAGSPHSVSLTGTGTSPTPAVTLTPTGLTFSSQVLNTTSGAQSLTLANTGTATLNITSIAASGDYAQTTTCGSTLAASGSCSISVTFTPTATGTRTGAITVTDNASGSPHTVSLTGTGANAASPAVSLTPTGLTFASQVINTTSAAQSVTLKNTGTATLNITSIAASGDYAQTTTCGSTLAASGSCSISVTFTPTATGTRTGTITVTDNASGSPHSASLTGTGANAASPAVSLTPTGLTFASQVINTTSAAQSVTLKNTGTATLNITSIAASGDYARTTTCGSTLAASASCSISVTFTPTATGTRTGTITVTDNASGSPHSASLTGTGANAAPSVSLSSTSVAFGNQQINVASSVRNVTLTNTGNAALTITGFTVTGTNSAEFTQTNTCGSSVAAAASCTISVTFRPTATGSRTASISIADNASNSPQSIGLTGTGTNTTTPQLTFSPTSFTFAAQTVGTQSATQTLTVRNSGTVTVTLVSGSFTGTNASDFSFTTNCPASLAVGASCTASLRFTPGAVGARTASFLATDNAAGSPQSMALSGTGK